MQSLKILVVEDFEEYRRVVCSLLQKRTEFKIELSSDGLEAVQKAETIQPDLILLDIGLPTLNGMEVARRVHKLALGAKILFFSVESEIDLVIEALTLGAAYVHKPRAQRDLFPALEAVLRGERFVSDGLLPTLPSKLLPMDLDSALSKVVAQAVEMAEADKGSLQILDPQTNTLHMAAQSGFSNRFLQLFGEVQHNLASSCTTAISRGQRVIVDDVASDPIFQGTKSGETILGEGIRSVQSIPLKTLSGRLVGVLSTHFRVSRPSRQKLLKITDAFAQEVAELIRSKTRAVS